MQDMPGLRARKLFESTMKQDLKLETPGRFLLPTPERRASLAYRALVLFSGLYFLRPEDFIPGLSAVPLGKVAGGIALLALLFGVKPKDRGRLPAECKVLLVLLAHMILTIPFAYWRGGAIDTVINKFSKGVIIALLITLVITHMSQLRKLLYIQAASVAMVTVASLLVRHTQDGRLMGIQKGILENPNDLAINIAINFPLCLAFMFSAKGGLRKVLWAFGLIAMLYGVVATYSRSGMIAMMITGIICLWEFGIKGRRTMLLMSTAILGVVAVGVMLVTPHYLVRIESLFRGNIEGSGDRGSLEARSQLLKESLRLMEHNPFLGVGPGNFAAVTGEWRVAHNTYTELGAEAGVPGLVLFVLMLVISLRRIRRVQKLPGYEHDPSIRLWRSALWAAMAAYSAGAAFASTEYNLFPYFMVGYICALYQIASHPAGNSAAPSGHTQDGGKEQLEYGRNRERELAWSR
jgi:putative inorganic carbon (hco3(-)) transporter